MIEYCIISHSMLINHSLIIHVNSTLKAYTSILKCIYEYPMTLFDIHISSY